MDGVELGEKLLAVRYGLHDVACGREWVDGTVDEFVEFRVVRDQPHADSVRLGDEEGWADPPCRDVDLGDHIFVDEVLDDDVCLSLVRYLRGILRATTSW